MDEIACPHCGSAGVIRKGVRKDKFRLIQLYCCKLCCRTFSLAPMRKVKYPPRIILDAVSSHNLGYAQREVAKLIARNHRIKVPERTVNSWINRLRDICTFHRLRERATGLHPAGEMVFSQNLQHRQIYEFKLHRAKLELQARELPEQKIPSAEGLPGADSHRRFSPPHLHDHGRCPGAAGLPAQVRDP